MGIVCVREYGPARNEHSQNSILMITLYVEYSNRNGLFSGAHSNVNAFDKLDSRIKSLASKCLGSSFKTVATYLCSAMFLLPNPLGNKLQICRNVQNPTLADVHFHNSALLTCM